MHMGMMVITISHLMLSYGKANHRTQMLVKAKVLEKARRGNVWPTRVQPRATEPTQGQPNTMEVKFIRLEALVTNMVA